MKSIIFMVLLIPVIIVSKAQVNMDWGMPYNTEKKLFIYEEVVPVAGIKKEELYKRAYNWVSIYYVSGLKKIFEKDSIQGIIKLNDRFTLMKIYKGQKINDVIINYRLEISFKDGKFRYQIFKFYNGVDAMAQPIERWMIPVNSDPEIAKQRYTNIDIEIQKAITSLKKSLKAPIPIKKDDW